MNKLAKRKKKRVFFRLLFVAFITFFVLFYCIDFARDAVLKAVYPVKYSEIVEENAKKYDIDKYLIYAMIKTESKFKEDAESKVGAKGLMQLMDETADECNKKGGFNFDIPNDILKPEVNIALGCFYLNQLLVLHDGDVSLSVAAYNGGVGNVSKWLSDSSLSDGDGGLLDIPFEETKGYVDKVLSSYEKYKEIYEKNGGF